MVTTERSAGAKVAALKLVDVEPTDDIEAEPSGSTTDHAPTVDEPFEAFYRREFPRLVVLAHALAGPTHAADVAQDAMSSRTDGGTPCATTRLRPAGFEACAPTRLSRSFAARRRSGEHSREYDSA